MITVEICAKCNQDTDADTDRGEWKMVMMMTVRLMEQKGFEEPEGSSEVTGPVQQGEVRGGFFGRELFFFPQRFSTQCFLC